MGKIVKISEERLTEYKKAYKTLLEGHKLPRDPIYNYVKGYHSTFNELPREVKKFIIAQGIESPETKMFDVDVYYDIDIRNFWEKE